MVGGGVHGGEQVGAYRGRWLHALYPYIRCGATESHIRRGKPSHFPLARLFRGAYSRGMATFTNNPGSTHSSVLEGIRDPGNRSAWDRFYGQYAPFVHALAVCNGLRHADAEDLVQTVFAEMAERMRTFDYDREKGCFHNWLAEAARFRIQDFQRRNTRRENRELAMPDTDPPAPDDFGDMVEKGWGKGKKVGGTWRGASGKDTGATGQPGRQDRTRRGLRRRCGRDGPGRRR